MTLSNHTKISMTIFGYYGEWTEVHNIISDILDSDNEEVKYLKIEPYCTTSKEATLAL